MRSSDRVPLQFDELHAPSSDPRDGEAWRRLALEASGAATWTIDYRRGVEHFDARACEIAGLDARRREWPSGSFCSLLHPDDRLAMQAAQAATLRAAGPGPMQEYRVVRPDGEVRVLRGAGIAHRDAHGAVTQFIGVSTDVTDARRVEQALREADREKDAFLATLAHELRNPLAPLRNVTNLLRRQCALSPAVDATLGMLERQIVQMTRIVDDLSTASYVAHDRLELRIAPCRIADLLRSAVESVEPAMHARAQHLQLDAPDAERIMVAGDAGRLVQCVANLLSNASKYSPEGSGIVLRARANADRVTIEVIDRGRGIAPRFLPRVFELFVRHESAPSGEVGGLGIGLALVKRVVALHGGEVEAASAGEGEGATFTIRLARIVDSGGT